MNYSWSKAYKPKRKLYIKQSLKAESYEEFCEENGGDWYKQFESVQSRITHAELFYLPEQMVDDGYSRLCGGVEVVYSDVEDAPEGCDCRILPGFGVVVVKNVECSKDDRIAEIVQGAYNYAKNNIEDETVHIVSDGKLPYACYRDEVGQVCVEIPVWIQGGTIEKWFEFDSMSKKDLYNAAYRESATGYYNWTWLKEKLEQCTYIGLEQFVFVRFDIKGYSLINNVMGREVSKELFRFVCNAMAKQDWILYSAKCEADNFAMIVRYMPEMEIMERLHEFFNSIDCLPSNRRLKLFYSCGLVVYDEKEQYCKEMRIEDMAQMAHLQCTKTNVNEIKVYTSKMKIEYIMAKQYKLELPEAIENEDLTVYLQPKYDPHNDKLTGAEALIRWYYKGGDILAPKYFVPQFEADGTIDAIDRFVLIKVCKKFKEWIKKGYPLFTISCNLSRRQISKPDLVKKVCDIVDEYGIDHSLIEFEVTESADFSDVQYLVSVLWELKNKGFRISMDDFGTGYSSLALLKDMPIDVIKIDKSFIDGISSDDPNDKDMLLAQDILAIARHLGIKSLAEGVETYEQKEALRQWGCHYIQGYYYSRPIPISEYEKLLEKEAQLDEEDTKEE